MKYVYLANSHTTFLSSLGTINYLGIKDTDVIFLFARGYSNSIYPLPYTLVNIDDIYLEADNAFTSSNPDVRSFYIRKVDEIVNNSIQDNFYLYVPNFCNPVVRLLYTNHNCKRISFIQEGAQIHLTAFKNNYPLRKTIREVVSNLLHRRPFRVWLKGYYYRSDYLYKQKRMYTYGLDNEIFSGIEAEHHIIKWPVPNITLKYEPNATYFILDGLVKNKMCEKEVLLKNTKRLIEENASSYNYLKFHPNQAEEEVKEIISYFINLHLKYEIMDQSFPFELIIIYMHDLKVVGMASSLCFFAKQLGHHVVCHDDWLYNESDLFRKHLSETGIRLYKDIYNP